MIDRESISTNADHSITALTNPNGAATVPERPPWSFRFSGKDKVAIVGFAQSHRDQAPFQDPAFEIWGLNNAYIFMPPRPHVGGRIAERWFEIHSDDQFGWDLRRPGQHVAWLAKFPGPLYLLEARRDMPNSIRYPIEDIVSRYGAYITSSPAYMLLMAMAEGFKEIHIYGIDLATDSEYADQRPNLEFLIGVAIAKGHQIFLPPGCQLLQGKLYARGKFNSGGEHHTRQQFEGRLGALQKRLAEVQAEKNRINQEQARIEGAILECQHWVGRTPEGQPPEALLASMSGPGKEIVEAKGGGGIGSLAAKS